jgi:DNA replicative helicase MCM subunit Mcm2 (Cdc46/Mcm family)
LKNYRNNTQICQNILSRNIKLIEIITKLTIALAKCHLRSIIQKKDVFYIIKFVKKLFKNEKIFFGNENKEKKKILFENIITFDQKKHYLNKIEKIKENKENRSIIEIKKRKTIKKFISKINSNKLNFFKIKKIYFLKNNISYIERFIAILIEKKFCLIIQNIILKFKKK